jgi:tetratricopeptide (TPR) repeat protein
MLARLDQQLSFLIGGARDAPARQQTMRATIAWSYELLTAVEKSLFRRLAVFAGGCTLAALDALGNVDGTPPIDNLEGVASLIDKSLLLQQADVGGEQRFMLLRVIRDYALERLIESGEAEAMRSHFAAYFLALAEEAEPQLTGAEQQAWLERLAAEHDNLRAALAWCMGEDGGEIGLRLAGALWRFWEVRDDLGEGRLWLERVLARMAARTAGRAKALAGAGRLAFYQGDYAAARMFHEESLSINRELGDKQGIAFTLNNLGIMAVEQGDYEAARDLHEESLAIRREAGDKWGIAASLNNLGNVALNQGDYETARVLHEKSLAIKREVGDKQSIAISLNNLGNIALNQGDYAAARVLLEESLALQRAIGNKRGAALALNNLGEVAHHEGDYHTASILYGESLAIRSEVGDKQGIAECLVGLAGVARIHQQIERAAQLLGVVEALLESIGGCLERTERALYEHNIAAVQAVLDKEQFAAAWAAGRTMSLEQAVTVAHSLNV